MSAPSSYRWIPPKYLQLPLEIWVMILSDLSNVSLKALRLTCSSWRQLGTESLYDTVCLDSFEESWSNLRSLSFSPLAHHVRTIVVRPLYVPKECMQVATWCKTYSNLLAGLSPSTRFSLHREFQTLFVNHSHDNDRDRGVLGELDTTFTDLSNLTQCHRVIFSDDSDLESRSRDANVRRSIQREPHALRTMRAWGLRPPALPFAPGDAQFCNSTTVFQSVLGLLKRFPSISRLELSIWDLVWSSWINHPRVRTILPTCQHLTHVSFQTKFCHTLPILRGNGGSKDYCHGLNTFLGGGRVFPNLKSLTLSAKHTMPDTCYIKVAHPERRINYVQCLWALSEDNFCFDQPSSTDPYPHFPFRIESEVDTYYVYDEFDHGGIPFLTRQEYQSLIVHVVPSLSQFKRLEIIELRDICVSASTLLAWLIHQRRDSNRPLHIKLAGTTILYGMNPAVFLAAIQSLPVILEFDAPRTVYIQTSYFENIWDLLDEFLPDQDFEGTDMTEWATHWEAEDLRARYFTFFSRGVNTWNLEKQVWEGTFDDVEHLRNIVPEQISPNQVTVARLPGQFQRPYLVRHTPHRTGLNHDYYYCTWSKTDNTLKFDWHDHRLTAKSDAEENYLLLVALTYRIFEGEALTN